MVYYLPQESMNREDIEIPGLLSATLGLDFVVEPYHFQPVSKSKGGSGDVKKRELWVKCEATMPPIDGSVFPYVREVFLGAYESAFNRYESISASKSPLKPSYVVVVTFATYCLILFHLLK